MLNKINQTQKNKHHMFSLICRRKVMGSAVREEGEEEGI
jgi:hypothetical protein